MGSFRMNESDLCAAGTDTRFFVNQTSTFFLEICQSSLKIIHAQGDMLDAATAAVLLDEFGNRGSLIRCCQQLDLAAVRRWEEARRYFLLSNGFFTIGRQTKNVAPERTNLFEVRNSNYKCWSKNTIIKKRIVSYPFFVLLISYERSS